MWKQFKHLSADEQINKWRYSHTMKYYLTIKRNEVLLHATTWMNLENFVSDRSQTQRPHLCEMSGGGESVRMGSDFE
jgi:hypothetical protein